MGYERARKKRCARRISAESINLAVITDQREDILTLVKDREMKTNVVISNTGLEQDKEFLLLEKFYY